MARWRPAAANDPSGRPGLPTRRDALALVPYGAAAWASSLLWGCARAGTAPQAPAGGTMAWISAASPVVVDTVLGLYAKDASQAPRGTNRSGYARCGDLATKTERDVQPGHSTTLVAARGSAFPDDGGGGVFYWDGSGTAATDDGGTVIVPNAPGVGTGTGYTAATGCWRRITTGPAHARWFGPAGGLIDKAIVDDTEALQNAIDYASNVESEAYDPKNASAIAFTSMALDLGFGFYFISRALTVSPLRTTLGGDDSNFCIFSESRAVLRQRDASQDILRFGTSTSGTVATSNMGNRIRGIVFVGGRTQIAFASQKQSLPTLLHVQDCDFRASGDFAVQALAAAPADHMTALVTLDHCGFYGCAAALQTNADATVVDSCWVQTPPAPIGDHLAVFRILEGTLTLRSMIGVGGIDNRKYAARWIDNYGSVFVEHSRFGGDGAAGMPIVFHYTPLNASLNNLDGRIVIRDSVVTSGSSGAPTTAVVYVKNDEPTSATACPSMVVLEGLTGPYSPPFVAAANGDNLEALLSGRQGAPPRCNPAVRSQIRISIDSGSLSPAWIDKALLPFASMQPAAPPR